MNRRTANYESLSGGLRRKGTAIFRAAMVLATLIAAAFSFGADEATPRRPLAEGFGEDTVDWHSWSAETQLLAKQAGRPVLFSISHEINGLSFAMAKESYGNVEIARRINDGFFAVSIDKCEYPIVAEFLEVFVEHSKQVGGWPLTVFATPDLEPIDGGGYYPPTDDWGSQGLASVLKSVAEQWGKDSDIVKMQARDGVEDLSQYFGDGSVQYALPFEEKWVDRAIANLSAQFDFERGGFTLAPKAVSFAEIAFLDRVIDRQASHSDQARKMRDLMVEALLGGGVRDYVRGGYFSASVDDEWLIPDFSKSSIVQVRAIDYFSRKPEHASVVKGLGECLVRDFRLDNGLYADRIAVLTSEGKLADEIGTGIANTWSHEELDTVLNPDELNALAEYVEIGDSGNLTVEQDIMGNYTGRNVLRANAKTSGASLSPAAANAVDKLYAASKESRFLHQETVASVATNAMVASAFLKIVNSGESHYQSEARSILDTLWDTLFDADNEKLMASAYGTARGAGEASSIGYALLIQAFLDLADYSEDKAIVDRALRLQKILDTRFLSEEGVFWIAPKDSDGIPVNLYAFKEGEHGAANAIQIGNLRRLGLVLSDDEFLARAEGIVQKLPEECSYAPERHLGLLEAALGLGPSKALHATEDN